MHDDQTQQGQDRPRPRQGDGLAGNVESIHLMNLTGRLQMMATKANGDKSVEELSDGDDSLHIRI
jgi:hypothetical protein